MSAEFIQANVLQLSGKLNRQFDIVFTSYGTIVWLPKLETWGKVIAEHLKPGGVFYMAEFHPAMLGRLKGWANPLTFELAIFSSFISFSINRS